MASETRSCKMYATRALTPSVRKMPTCTAARSHTASKSRKTATERPAAKVTYDRLPDRWLIVHRFTGSEGGTKGGSTSKSDRAVTGPLGGKTRLRQECP